MVKRPAQLFKEHALKQLPRSTGVYGLCDLDEVPIYIGKSVDAISARVRRHLTSARSDVIANRQIDVWEIAYVWAWPLDDKSGIDRLEAHLFHRYNEESPLVNGSIPAIADCLDFEVPELIRVQVMDDTEIANRLDPVLRYPRQIQHFGALVDYILNTQDKPHLRRALQVYFERLSNYHHAFLDTKQGQG